MYKKKSYFTKFSHFLLNYKKENSFLLDFIYFFTTFALILPLEHVRRKNNCKLFYFNIL